MDDRSLVYLARLEIDELRRRGQNCAALREVVERLELLDYTVSVPLHTGETESDTALRKVEEGYMLRQIANAVGKAVIKANPPKEGTSPVIPAKTFRFLGYVLKSKAK